MSRERYGEGSIYERKDGRFSGYIVLENHKRKYFYGKTKKEVLDKLKKAQREQEDGMIVPGQRQTVKQFLEHWLENVQKLKIEFGSYLRYREMLDRYIIGSLGHIQLQKLKTEHIEAFYAQLSEKGLAPRTLRMINAVLHSALQYAVKKKKLAKNVCDGIDLPRVTRYHIQPLSKEQAQQLLHAAKGHRLEALITVALATGMRRGELLALRWSDINFEIGSIQVQRTVNRFNGHGYIESEPKTAGSRRNIFLPQFVIDVLRIHQQKQLKDQLEAGSSWVDRDLVFCNIRGDFWNTNNMVQSFKKLVSSAGLPPMRFHDLRHSAATILLTMGVHPKIVQELLGHSQISMTMDTYSHVLPSMLRDAMNGLNDMFGDTKS